MNKNNKIEKDMMAKQIDWNISTVITLIFCIAAPIIVGTLASFFTQNAMLSFNSMNKPPFAPPAMLFPIAWTILYILMCKYRPDRAHCTVIECTLSAPSVHTFRSVEHFVYCLL